MQNSLFEIPTRNDKKSDLELAKKIKTPKKSNTIKGGLIHTIELIRQNVKDKLGGYKDKFILIQDMQALDNYINACISNNVISMDTETTGLDPLQDDIVGICIYTPNQKAAYIPLNHIDYITQAKLPHQLEISNVADSFRKLISSKVDIIMFNAKFDMRFLKNKIGLNDIYCTWDCLLAAKLLNENEDSHALKKLHQKYVLDGKVDAFTFDDLFKGIKFNLVPLDVAMLYAANDPLITYEFYEYQKQFLNPYTDREDMKKLYEVFKNIEMPCIDAVAQMEDIGIAFDIEYQKELSEKYHKILDEQHSKFYEMLEEYKDVIDIYKDKLDNPINLASPEQLSVLFYDVLNVGVIDKKSPRGTGKDILRAMNNPLADLLLEIRATAKLIDSFIDSLPSNVNPIDGRIHCNLNQYGAKTGRMSCSNPNVQQIPSHNKDIRPVFIASEGYVMMSSDFSSQEPKCLASICKKDGDSQMYDTFMQGKDLYCEIASKAFNVPYEECKEFNADGTKNPEGKERRNQAKKVLLSVLYGRGTPSVAEQLGCSIEKAQNIKDSVFKAFPAIKKFEESSLEMARELGYVTTICGRKRRLPSLQLPEYEFIAKDGFISDDLLDFSEINNSIPQTLIDKYTRQLRNKYKRNTIIAEADKDGITIVDNTSKIADATRQCVNSRIQGSASDLTKMALIKLHENARLKELGFRMLVPIHDEVLAECPLENAKECAGLLSSIMSSAAESLLGMSIKCDVEVTDRWYGNIIEI